MRSIFGILVLIVAMSVNSEVKRPTTDDFIKSTVYATTVGRLCKGKGAELSAAGANALFRMGENFGSPEKLFATAEWQAAEEGIMGILDRHGCEVTISAVRKLSREKTGISFLEY